MCAQPGFELGYLRDYRGAIEPRFGYDVKCDPAAITLGDDVTIASLVRFPGPATISYREDRKHG